MKKTTLLAVLFGLLVLGYIVISSFRPKPYRCRICITFHGNRDCRTASADTKEDALRTATSNVCGLLAGGVTDSNQCANTPPDSLEWLQSPAQ